uniref:LPXTG cell wall anchor domain-containing protein n=1 Tax=uncultured Streptococcus sp. TaxID=83427 RepID=UPI0028D2445B
EVTVGDATVVATKNGSTWTLSPTTTGVSIDSRTGVVTVAHNAASAGTQVSATAKHGNSDASTAASVALPGKAATPAAPTVASDEANARVTVTPSADADRVEVTVGDATVVATKTGSTWSLSPAKDGVSVDPTNGVITVAHNAASAGTQVRATAKHGNSDASTASTANLPAKETTPNAPTVVSDTANARVTVTPSADADRVEVTVGNSTVVATKTGSTWSLTPSKDGVSVDSRTGVVTVAHNAASAGTQVSATAKHGNSDVSTASRANLPAKETTPNAPTVVSDTANARVTVTPSADADRVEVTVGDATVVATKTAGEAAIPGVHNNGDLEELKTAAKVLPNTGTENSVLAIPVAITSALLSLSLVGGRRRKEN